MLRLWVLLTFLFTTPLWAHEGHKAPTTLACNDALRKIEVHSVAPSFSSDPVESEITRDDLVKLLGGERALAELQRYNRNKRFIDVVLVTFSLPVIAAVMAGAATAIKMENFLSPKTAGSIFFRQIRVGADGKSFEIVKFRTMVPHAENQGPLYTRHHDTRVTHIGRILRKFKIDEVPQLYFNVLLRGEMSLVGPRPMPEKIDQACASKNGFWTLRQFVRPGLTGNAQVSATDAKTEEESLHRLAYDLYPIVHRSLWQDFKIMLRTVGVIFKGKVCP